MLKFIKHHMTSITDIELYPVISFILFFVFFIAVLILIFKKDRNYINRMQQLPLEDNTINHDTELL